MGVHLWLSSNQSAGDVFVYLSDVAPDGTACYVSEGQLRTGFHELQDPRMQTGYTLPVQPELPWHGYRAQDYTAEVFADGRTVELKFDLMPVSYVFRNGHRIRLAIAGADSGNFEWNPALHRNAAPGAHPETDLYIHRGVEMPSRIVIPIISTADDLTVKSKECCFRAPNKKRESQQKTVRFVGSSFIHHVDSPGLCGIAPAQI